MIAHAKGANISRNFEEKKNWQPKLCGSESVWLLVLVMLVALFLLDRKFSVSVRRSSPPLALSTPPPPFIPATALTSGLNSQAPAICTAIVQHVLSTAIQRGKNKSILMISTNHPKLGLVEPLRAAASSIWVAWAYLSPARNHDNNK